MSLRSGDRLRVIAPATRGTRHPIGARLLPLVQREAVRLRRAIGSRSMPQPSTCSRIGTITLERVVAEHRALRDARELPVLGDRDREARPGC